MSSYESNPINHRVLAAYLDQVMGRLVSLPVSLREEIRHELRQHLDSSIAAREELGEPRDAATASSVRAFGAPEGIASRFRRAYATTGKRSQTSPLPAFTYALKLFVPLSVLFLSLRKVVFCTFPYQQFDNLHNNLLLLLVNSIICLFYVLHIVLGCIVGWKRSGNSMVGVTTALATLGLGTLPLCYFYFPWYEAQINNVYLPAGVMFFLWIPLAAIPAAIAGRLKTRLRYPCRWVSH